MSEVLIRTRQLTKSYGATTAVDSLDLEVKSGEIYGFLGPNGAGKTTTIRMLSGLLDASAGEAFICGYDISKEASQAKAMLAYVPDQPKLYGKLTAREFLQLVAALYRIPKMVSQERSDQLLSMFVVAERADELLEG